MQWDIFCRVIDNFGDVGVCWRLANQLIHQGQQVRLWLDDPTALRWMATSTPPKLSIMPWEPNGHPLLPDVIPGDVVVEAFGCHLPDDYLHLMQTTAAPTALNRLWLNLEYLTAEDYADKCHLLPSPVMAGPGKSLTKHFFYPGFTEKTGGLLRESGFTERQKSFDVTQWLAKWGLNDPPQPDRALRITLFCYEPTALPSLLKQLCDLHRPVELFVTAGRSAAAVQACMALLWPDCRPSTENSIKIWRFGKTDNDSSLSILQLPFLTQEDFDHLLWSSDLNFVRGEDSLTRAIWAGKPFVWQLYPQADGAHLEKLNAFLAICQPSVEEREWFSVWNGNQSSELPPLESLLQGEIQPRLQQKLQQHASLVEQLMGFALDKTR